MGWLLQQLDILVTAAGAICGWEGAKWLDQNRPWQKRPARSDLNGPC